MPLLTTCCALLLAVALPAGATVSPKEARAIAKQAYVYGVPMVDQWRGMYAFSIDTANPQYKGPFNTILNIARVFTPDDTAFVTPNADTPYTFIALDLRAEPMVLTVPSIDAERYYVFQLMDLYTFNFGYVGSRATGNRGGRYLIAGPHWRGKAPDDVDKLIRAETDLVTVVGRTQLLSPTDLENVKQVQAGYRLEPLSAHLGAPPPSPAPPVAWRPPLPAGEERTSLAFFDQLAFLLQFAQPPHASEVALRDRFARIGIVPGQPFDAAALSPEMRAALTAGMVDGQREIDARRAKLQGRTDTLFGSRPFLKNDYVARATGAQVGIGANSRDEAMYTIYDRDAAGQPLDGGAHAYTLRFAKGQLPPVNAFWSVTMYDLPKQLLVRNPIDRYLINSPMLPGLKTDADGGITLHLQAESPGADRESNWLPAPRGPFMVTLRYYWPAAALLKGRWKAPKIEVHS